MRVGNNYSGPRWRFSQRPAPDLVTKKDAYFSPCRTWRYSLTRQWGPGRGLNVVGLNPSTADESIDDPTVRRCIGFARRWGYESLVVTNLFALRSTDPKALLLAPDPKGPDNFSTLMESAWMADRCVVAWGTWAKRWPEWTESVLSQMRLVVDYLWCLGETKEGFPKHPLYLSNDVEPTPYGGKEER